MVLWKPGSRRRDLGFLISILQNSSDLGARQKPSGAVQFKRIYAEKGDSDLILQAFFLWVYPATSSPAVLTVGHTLSAIGALTVASLLGYAVHKRKYIHIRALQLMNRKRRLLHMYVYERDRNVARAAQLAMTKTRSYSGYFEDSAAHTSLLQLIDEWAAAGEVDRIATMLGDPTQTVDQAATEALARLGATKTQMANGYLAVIASTAKSYFKVHAIEELGRLDDRRAIKPLLNLLNNEDRGIRSAASIALDCLRASGQEKRGKYIAATSSKDVLVSQDAVWQLVSAGDRHAIRPLLAMLGDRERGTRSSAEESLVELGASKEKIVNGYIAVLSSRALKKDFQEDFEYSRMKALETLLDVIERLGSLGDKRAIAPLIGLLTFNHAGVRACVNKALKEIGASKEAMAAGNISALSCKIGDARIDAAKRLGEMGDRRAIAPLLRLLKDEERDARSTAERALTQLGAGNEVVDVYLDVLRSQPRPPGYSAMLDYFIQAKAGRAVSPLIKLIYQPRPGFEVFYKEIVRAVGKIGDRSAIAPLNQLLQSRWRWVTVDDRGRQMEVKETDSAWIRQDVIEALKMLG